jgi:GT2 family glycosyltransferase
VDSVSVAIVRYADDPRLESCLAGLKAQEGVVLDVVIVENGAAPGAPPPEPWKAPGGAIRTLGTVRREANPGFAAAFNEAWERLRGDWVVSLNPDCRLDPDAVRAARDALAADAKAGAVALRLVRPGRDVLDSAGIRVSPVLLRARDLGRGGPAAGRYLEPTTVDAACLAGAMLRRAAADQARDGAGEILDTRYFAYQEDVDLGWRMRRAGYHVRYEPRAVGEHERGWREGRRRDMPVFLRRTSLRNRWFTILKNVSWPGLAWRLPFLCVRELAAFLWLLVTEPAVTPAFASAVAGIPGTIRRRPLARRAAHDRRAR